MIGVLAAAWGSLTEAFFMFWETLWALILGFLLSGAVQAFVSRHQMQQAMGDHRPRTVVRAGLLGAASSSCSYAATALAKSLFQRGADFTTAMVFMIASTNLVVELGIVLWLLVGWQFALAEFVGGAIMIALFVLVAPRIFPAAELTEARTRLNRHAGQQRTREEDDGLEPHGDGLAQRLRSKALWADAAGYAISDLTMLRRELLIGYLVAGILAVAVPASAYDVVFLHGHGFLTDLENVAVGPLVALVSFVCSIGNVPLAAALFRGGLSFGGTVAFVFADLIALPLVLIYGKFYGRRIALRLLVTFWAVMSLAGLAVDLLFRLIGIPAPARPAQIAPTHLGWNATTALNLVFLIVAAGAYLLYRNRDRFGGARQYAHDVVCGMQVERAHAPAAHVRDGTTYFFCSDRCHDKFVTDPANYLENPGRDTMSDSNLDTAGTDVVIDPVCGMEVDPAHPAATAAHDGVTYSFCSTSCQQRFVAHPDVFVGGTHDRA